VFIWENSIDGILCKSTFERNLVENIVGSFKKCYFFYVYEKLFKKIKRSDRKKKIAEESVEKLGDWKDWKKSRTIRT
jgi:hypothetical protein